MLWVLSQRPSLLLCSFRIDTLKFVWSLFGWKTSESIERKLLKIDTCIGSAPHHYYIHVEKTSAIKMFDVCIRNAFRHSRSCLFFWLHRVHQKLRLLKFSFYSTEICYWHMLNFVVRRTKEMKVCRCCVHMRRNSAKKEAKQKQQ